MMKVTFCQRFVYSYFGIMSLSAMLKKGGHHTELVLERVVSKAVDEILRLDPDVVMFSTLTATGDFEWSLEVAKGIKQANRNILTAFGGLHPTLFPEETMANAAVDIICRGEGEIPALELCNRLDRGEDYSRTPSLWVKSPEGIVKNPLGMLGEDLDLLPFPDRDLYQKYGYFNNLNSIDVMAGRGCLFNCSFCMNGFLRELHRGKGKYIRKFSPEYVVRELEEVKKKFKPRSLTFVDELFTTHKEWVREFSQVYKSRIGLPFTCSVTANTIDDESAAWLADAGAHTISMGLETGNEELRRGLLNKPLTDTQLEKAAYTLHRHGIKVLTSNVVGWPGETVDNAFQTIEFNQKIKTDFVYFTIFQPYPELPLTKKMQAEGVLAPIPPADFNATMFRGSMLEQKNIQQLVNLHKFFFLVFTFPWLKPLVKHLIRLPPNWFFDQIFILSYAWMALTCYRRHPLQLLAMAFGNMRIFYNDKGVSR
jgi:radical SAM superfamily enzyme YgiQ (UPF0313 family)